MWGLGEIMLKSHEVWSAGWAPPGTPCGGDIPALLYFSSLTQGTARVNLGTFVIGRSQNLSHCFCETFGSM